MSGSANFVPLSEMEGFSSERLSWRLPLPEYVPTDKIGVDVERLNHLTWLGGLAHLRVDVESGDQTTYYAEATSMDAQGNATAGMKAVKSQAALSSSGVEQSSLTPVSRMYSAYRWGDARVSINSTELGARALMIAKGESLRDANLWSRLIDGEIRKGVSKAAANQLLHDLPFLDKWFFGLSVFTTATWGGYIPNLNTTTPLLFLGESLFLQGTSAIIAHMSGTHLRERRLSLIPGYQLDRLFAVKALAKTQKIVRPIKGS